VSLARLGVQGAKLHTKQLTIFISFQKKEIILKFRQNLTGLADAIINGSFAHPNFLALHTQSF